MEFLFGSYWFYILIGGVLGATATTSGMFREGGGLVLLFGMVIAVIAAAVLGALTPLLPAALAAITSRAALLFVCFAVAAFFSGRRR